MVRPISTRASTPAPRDLLRGLRAVATVGDEQRVVGAHEQRAGRAGEAGEVAHVRPARDEQRGQVLGGQRGPQAGQPTRDIHGRERGGHLGHVSSSRAATASIAILYPVSLNPAMTPSTTGVSTDLWRHASRACGFDRWSSIFTPSYAASASVSA